MTTLADTIDRLTSVGKSIRSTARTISDTSSAGPFAHAVLHTHLGDLIRDADPSEVGLFTLIQSPRPDEEATTVKEISRAEFHGATPLRKPTNRYGMKMKEREPEPEVYAQAALKYLDRYQHIRSMPRARSQVLSILEDLASTRDSIASLQQATAQPLDSGQPTASPKSMIAAEERRIQEIQKQMTELKKQKEALLHGQVAPRKRFPARNPDPPKPSPPAAPKADAQEELFWNTPASRVRTLHFTESLMDESVDVGNITTTFSSPLAAPASRGARDMVEEDEPEEEDDHTDEVEEEAEQNTVVLSQSPDEPKSPTPPDTPASAVSVDISPETPSHPPPTASTESARKPKIRITTEVERVVAKIWKTVGDRIMPGHHYTESKAPRAKETIAHLQSLSILPPTPTSPVSVSSLSMQPTLPSTQQVLTARLLLALLTAPSRKAPLRELKGCVTGTPDPADGMRALYQLVARKLITINRATREQVVEFDMSAN